MNNFNWKFISEKNYLVFANFVLFDSVGENRQGMARYYGRARNFPSTSRDGEYDAVIFISDRIKKDNDILWKASKLDKEIKIREFCLTCHNLSSHNEIDFFIRKCRIASIDFCEIVFKDSCVQDIAEAMADTCTSVSLRGFHHSNNMNMLLQVFSKLRSFTGKLRILHKNDGCIPLGLPLRQMRITTLDLGDSTLNTRRASNILMSTISHSSIETLSLARTHMKLFYGGVSCFVDARADAALNICKDIFLHAMPKSLVSLRLTNLYFFGSKTYLRRLITRRTRLDESRNDLHGKEPASFEGFQFKVHKPHCVIDFTGRKNMPIKNIHDLVF